MPKAVILHVLCAFLALGGCASGAASERSPVVFAAASLAPAFTRAAPGLRPLRPTFVFEGSQALVTKLTAGGAAADVVATVDERTMAALVAAGLVELPVPFASNELVIAVADGNPRGIRGLADLTRPDLLVVLAHPSVPIGAYTQQMLDAAAVTVAPWSLELDVRATLSRVESGEADAAIVYATDVKAGARSDAVTLPEAAGIRVTYPIAVLKAAADRSAALAFVAAVLEGVVRVALTEAGFGP